MPEVKEELLEEISKSYGDIRPYYMSLSLMVGKPQSALSNELRAVLEHIYRCSSPTPIEIQRLGIQVDKDKELEKAKDHLIRFKLDVYKAILLLFEVRIEKFEKTYRGLPIHSIHNARSFNCLASHFRRASGYCKDAKALEPFAKTAALEHYRKACDALLRIDKYMNLLALRLNCLKRRQRLKIAAYMVGIFIMTMLLAFYSVIIEALYNIVRHQ